MRNRIRSVVYPLGACSVVAALAACSSAAGEPPPREKAANTAQSLDLLCLAYLTSSPYYDQAVLVAEGLMATGIVNNYNECVSAVELGNDGFQLLMASFTKDETNCLCSTVFGNATSAHWVDNPLTKFTNKSIARTSSALDSYWGLDGSQHVNVIDVDGHLREYFLAQGGSWQDNDLTAIAINSQTLTAGATLPERSSPLDGYWQSGDSSQHVNFIDNTGHVHELFIHPGAGWVDNDLFQASILTGATAAGPRSQLDGYPEASDNSQHVNFVDANGFVHELFFNGIWHDNNLFIMSQLAPDGRPTQAAVGSALDGYWMPSDNSQHVNFISADGHIHELFFSAPFWHDFDLTARAANGGTPAAPGSAIDGYLQSSDNSQHVNFIAANGHVHELFFPQGGPWQDNDLTHNAVNGTSAQAGSHLHGYTEASDGSQHVNFTDANFHVHELFINPGSNGWIDNDLSNLAANGTPAVADSAIGGYWDATDDTQHVNFIDANGLVHELFF